MELVHARKACGKPLHTRANCVAFYRLHKADFLGVVRLEFCWLIWVVVLDDVNFWSSVAVLNSPIFEPLNHVELASFERRRRKVWPNKRTNHEFFVSDDWECQSILIVSEGHFFGAVLLNLWSYRVMGSVMVFVKFDVLFFLEPLKVGHDRDSIFNGDAWIGLQNSLLKPLFHVVVSSISVDSECSLPGLVASSPVLPFIVNFRHQLKDSWVVSLNLSAIRHLIFANFKFRHQSMVTLNQRQFFYFQQNFFNLILKVVLRNHVPDLRFQRLWQMVVAVLEFDIILFL